MDVSLIGERFNRLTVLSDSGERTATRGILWRCKCDCNNIVLVRTADLRRGHTKSCGCYKSETSAENGMANKGEDNGRYTHGHTWKGGYSPTYGTWRSMKKRCLNEKHNSFKDYGGRGITICKRWLNSFEKFLKDMGERPDGMTIDRIDANGNYRLSNCRWSDSVTQRTNRRSLSVA